MTEKIPKNNEIKSMFSAIKRDDLSKFEKIVKEQEHLMNFKNNKRENILFYAFKSNAPKIINYILEKKPDFIKEKNILNLNILHELVINKKDINLFLENFKTWTNQEKEYLFSNHDLQGNNILLLAAKHSNKEAISKIIDVCPNFEYFQMVPNYHNQNIAHLLALNIKENCDDIIKKLDPRLMNEEDSLNGYIPISIAAYAQNLNNFEEFFKLQEKIDLSIEKEKLIHFAANNNNIEVFNFLIKKGFFTNKKNELEQTPLGIAFYKSNIEIAAEIIKNIEISSEDYISQEDLIHSIKHSYRHKNIFLNILSSNKTEKLNSINQDKMIESLFFYSDFDTLLEISKQDEYRDGFNNLNVQNISMKIMAGKKGMMPKANFLLNKKETLTTEEVIDFCTALEILPKNQVNWLVKKSKFLSKIKEEDYGLIAALFMNKELPLEKDFLINGEKAAHQKYFRKLLKNSNSNLTESLPNIKNWIFLFEDKNIAYKFFGKLIAKEIDPLEYIQKNIKDLTKEEKKNLIYYTITAIIKDNKNLNEKVLNTLSSFPSLINNLIKEIIDYKKIPQNEKILGLVKDKNFISQEKLINLIETNKDKEELKIFIINYFHFFKIENILDENLIASVVNSKESKILFKKLTDEFPEKKNDLIELCFKLISDGKIKDIDDDFLSKDIISNKKFKKNIEEMFIRLFENNENIELKTLQALWGATSIAKEEINMFAQNLLSGHKFNDCIKLQKIIKEDFLFEHLDFGLIEWSNINMLFLLEDKEKDSLFNFLKENNKKISKKQADGFIQSIDLNLETDSISFRVIYNLVNSAENILNKVDNNKLAQLADKIIDDFYNKDVSIRAYEHGFFDLAMEKIINKLDTNNLEIIQNNKNFESLSPNLKSVVNMNILNGELKIKTNISSTRKAIKI